MSSRARLPDVLPDEHGHECETVGLTAHVLPARACLWHDGQDGQDRRVRWADLLGLKTSCPALLPGATR